MANKNTNGSLGFAYTGPAGETITRPVTALHAPYQGQATDGIDVPDATPSGTIFNVGFSSIDDSATGLVIQNFLTQEIEMRLNGNPPQVSGTLLSGVKVLAFPGVSATANLRVVAGATNGGTPGVLSARKSNPNEVTVESWLAGTGIQTADVSNIIVYDDVGPAINLPSNAIVVISLPTKPLTGKLTSVELRTTALQTGAGSIDTRVFGDPV